MNSEFHPSEDFVAKVMDRIEGLEAVRPAKAATVLTSRPVCFLLACGAPLLLLFRAAPVF